MRTYIGAGLGMPLGPGLSAAAGTTLATDASDLDAGDRIGPRLDLTAARLKPAGSVPAVVCSNT